MTPSATRGEAHKALARAEERVAELEVSPVSAGRGGF